MSLEENSQQAVAMRCVKCHATALFTCNVQAEGQAGGNLPIGALHGPRYDLVICGDCGYTEWYVQQAFLGLVREKLRPLNP